MMDKALMLLLLEIGFLAGFEDGATVPRRSGFDQQLRWRFAAVEWCCAAVEWCCAAVDPLGAVEMMI